MAEYYAVLSRAVASLETNTAEARRAVYDKARNALIGQLKAIVPPLPTSEISRQRLELEEAIRRAEREAAGGAPRTVGRPSQPQAAPPPREAVEPPPEPVYDEAEEVSAASPQDVFRRAIREAETRGGAAPPPPLERAAPARGDFGNPGADFHAGERGRYLPPEEPAPYVPPSNDYRSGRRPGREPRLAPDYEWEAAEAPRAEPAARYTPEPYLDGRDRDRDRSAQPARRRGGGREIEADFEDIRARPSRLPTILLLVVILAMVGGLAALAWSQRGLISDLIASVDNQPPVTTDTSEPPPAAPVADDTSNKDSDRLLAGNGIAASPGVRVVDQGGDNAAPADANAAGAVPVAQKAVLYEEPLDSAKAAAGVTQINAAVTWSYNPDGADGAVVVANLDVPERGLKIKVTFRKNSDQSLPASHLIEIITQADGNFPGKSISNVPRLVLKPAEDARGQPLIGASAKVADGFFWIALSALDNDIQNNLTLLKERSWIDLPLVYETGQRAILTFEKGTPGERAVDQALAAWTG